MDEQPQFYRDGSSIVAIDQKLKDPFLSNAESRFNSNMHPSPELLNELIMFHRKAKRNQYIYGTIAFIILVLVTTAINRRPNSQVKCTEGVANCSGNKHLTLFVGLFVGASIVCCVLSALCMWYFGVHRVFKKFKHVENPERTIFWRLDGEEWTRFLDYIHGPDRTWKSLPAPSWFFCRRKSYERLINRQYGHIILCERGIIIDELHFIAFQLYTLNSIEVQSFGEGPSILGLRIHSRFQARNGSRKIDFDLFAPSSIKQEQLLAITEQYNSCIPASKV